MKLSNWIFREFQDVQYKINPVYVFLPIITFTRSNISQVVAFSRKGIYVSISGLVFKQVKCISDLLPFGWGWNFSFSLLVMWHLNGNVSSLSEPKDSV